MKGDLKPMAAVVSDVQDWQPINHIPGCVALVNLTYFWHVGGAGGWIDAPFFETEAAARKYGAAMVAWWPPRVDEKRPEVAPGP